MTDGGYIIYGAEEWTESRLERLKFHIDHYMKHGETFVISETADSTIFLFRSTSRPNEVHVHLCGPTLSERVEIAPNAT